VARTWHTWGTVIVASLVALPVAVLLAAVLARTRRARGAPARRAWRESLAEVGMVAGTMPWIWMILTPRPGTRELNLVPLRELAGQLTGDPATAVEQIGGNLLVFAAFGFFSTIRWGLELPRVAVIAAAGSAVVELLQYVLDLGRVSSVDDVLLNAAGATAAAVVARLTRLVRHEYGGRS
jgi:VanZ like family